MILKDFGTSVLISTPSYAMYMSEVAHEMGISNEELKLRIGLFGSEGCTDALRDYVDMGNAKYGIYTDKIYQSIFREKAKEYKQVLKLSSKDRVRDTLYSEVLTLIASYECGLAELIKQQSEKLMDIY